MSEPPKENPDLKGGHPPAVKVAGGVRIVQKKTPHAEEEKTVEEKKEEQEFEEPPNPNDSVRVLVSGVPAKGDKDFPPEAIKAYHVKPLPTHEPHHTHVTQKQQIQQPRKQ